MPDIKTALTNAIQEKQMQTTAQTPTPEVLQTVREWAADDMRARIPRAIKYTGYLSRDVFLYVHANPGKTYKEVEKEMALLPYKYNVGSCGTLLSQMRKCGMMTRDEEGRYTAAVDKYAPVDKGRTKTRTYAMKKRPKKPAKAEVRGKISREKAPEPVPVQVAPAPVQATLKPTDLDKLLSELSFPQAIELYKKLRALLSTATNVPLL